MCLGSSPPAPRRSEVVSASQSLRLSRSVLASRTHPAVAFCDQSLCLHLSVPATTFIGVVQWCHRVSLCVCLSLSPSSSSATQVVFLGQFLCLYLSMSTSTFLVIFLQWCLRVCLCLSMSPPFPSTPCSGVVKSVSVSVFVSAFFLGIQICLCVCLCVGLHLPPSSTSLSVSSGPVPSSCLSVLALPSVHPPDTLS